MYAYMYSRDRLSYNIEKSWENMGYILVKHSFVYILEASNLPLRLG